MVSGAPEGDDPRLAAERIDERVVYDGDRRVARRRYATADGDASYDVVLDGAGTAVVAFTPSGEVVLTRQFRPGAERVMWDLPGGFVDAGETPAEAARRELREETGYEPGSLEVVGAVHPGAYSDEERHVVLARDCRRVSRPDPDDDEQIEVRLVSLDEFREILRAGDLTAVDAGYMALDHSGLLGGRPPAASGRS